MRSALLFLICLAGSFFNLTGPRCLELRLARLAIRLRPAGVGRRSRDASAAPHVHNEP